MNEKSIYELWRAKRLDNLIELGIVKGSIIEYLRLAHVYMMERENGATYTEAVRITSEKAGSAESTVKKAVARVI